MITEDYVSFETAKLLKEKGFDIPCNAYFVEVEKETAKNKFKRKFCHSSVVANRNAYKSEMANHYYFSCPTLQMAMKWLRETFGIHCQIDCPIAASNWVYGIRDLNKDEWVTDYRNMGDNDTYEEACKSAIKYCLKNLI